MTDKKILIIDNLLLDRIDENRGDLSRTEFLHYLIDNALGNEESPQETLPDQTQYLDRQEFEKFTRDMRDLLKRFLDFFLYNNVALDTGAGDTRFEDIARQLQSLSFNGAKTGKPH